MSPQADKTAVERLSFRCSLWNGSWRHHSVKVHSQGRAPAFSRSNRVWYSVNEGSEPIHDDFNLGHRYGQSGDVTWYM